MSYANCFHETRGYTKWLLGATLLPCSSWRLCIRFIHIVLWWKSNINLGKCNEHANVRFGRRAICVQQNKGLPHKDCQQTPGLKHQNDAPCSNIHWMRAYGPGSRVCLDHQFPCDHHQGCLNGQLWSACGKDVPKFWAQENLTQVARHWDSSSSQYLNLKLPVHFDFILPMLWDDAAKL